MYSTEDLDKLRGISTAAICDALDMQSRKQLVIPPPIRLQAGKRIFGPAITILMAVTGEKAFHNAAMETLDSCEEGSVLVLAGEPDNIASGFGAPEIAIADKRKLGGLLTDCMVRFQGAAADVPVGVAASGVSPASGFGRIKTMARCESSNCGGVTIQSGDLIVGDELGVLVIPAKFVKSVAEVAHLYEGRIDKIVDAIRENGSIARSVKDNWAINLFLREAIDKSRM